MGTQFRKGGKIMIWKLAQDKNWNSLEKQFSWVNDMQFVPQHREHHAEGNVAIHTQMVLDELQYIDEFMSLAELDREILWAAALLHDVEKRSTTVDEGDGNITAHGHARRGEKTARQILFKDVETPFRIREQIVSLVRFHGLPIWLLDKDDADRKVLEVALRLNTQHLAILSEADACGRKSESVKDLVENINLFKQYCKELDCWGQSRPFETTAAQYHYFNTEDSYIDYVPFENFKSRVILMSALPGMGKDYYIDSLKLDIPIISLDAIRRKNKIDPTDKKRNGWVVQEAKEQAKTYLRQGQDFIWNATNITTLMRKQLIDLFVDYGAYVKIVYIEKPYKAWRTQNKNREFPLPDNVLDKMLHDLEIPQKTEAHEVEYIVE